jgi:hypothetical protein
MVRSAHDDFNIIGQNPKRLSGDLAENRMRASAGIGNCGDEINPTIDLQTQFDVGFPNADLADAKRQPLPDVRLPLPRFVPADFGRNPCEQLARLIVFEPHTIGQ